MRCSFVTVPNLLSMGMLRQLRQQSFVATSIPVSAWLTLRCSLRRTLYVYAPALDSAFHPRIPSALLRGRRLSQPDSSLLSIRELRLEMVEYEVEVHAVGPAADENLKRLDTWWHTFVFETKNRQTLYTHQTLTRALINEHTSGITGIHLESLPAPGGLETRMSWGLTRLHAAVECRRTLCRVFLRVASCMRLWSDPSMPGKSLRTAVRDRLCSAKEMRSRCCFQAVLRSSEGGIVEASIAEQAHRPVGRALPYSSTPLFGRYGSAWDALLPRHRLACWWSSSVLSTNNYSR